MSSKEDGSLTATCQVGGHAQCSNIISMTNGGTQGVSQHVKNPPDFMTLLNHDAPRTQEQRPTILDALNRAVARGDKLFTVTDTHQHIDRGLYTYMTSYLAQAYRLSIN